MEQSMTQPQRRHYGLHNQGATCYLNSVLQVLFKTTEIHDRLDSKLQTDHQLRNIFEGLKKKTCRTETITRTFGIKNVYQQCDAAEYLEMILNKISPQASEVFRGELRYTTKCSKGHIINEETNPYWTLPLSLKDIHDTTYSVEKSFERIFQTKLFTGDNKVYCNECNKKTKATSGCEMVRSPHILTLLLKIFDFDYNTMSHVKSYCCVDVPHTLQIKNKTYKLYGMVNHMGSLYGGHYTATILSNEDETWYECNDAHVNKVKEQPFAETGTYNSRTVYLLIYRDSQMSDSQMSCETNSSNLDEPRRDEVECKENVGERDADNNKKRLMEHSEEDEEHMRKQKKQDFHHQTGGEEGDAESVKNDISVRETSPDINIKTGENCVTLSDVKSDRDEESQENLSINGDSITQENTAIKSEEPKEIKVDEAPVNVGEKSKCSSEQRLDEETETEKQKQKGDLIHKVKEEQEPSGVCPRSNANYVKHFKIAVGGLLVYGILRLVTSHIS